MKKNKSKVAIITGASRGIGKAIALKLDKEGFVVVLVSRSQKNLKSALKGFSKRAVAIPTDVSKEKDIISMVKKIIYKFGRVDVLINNAGWSSRKKIGQISKEDLERVIGTNLAGTFYCTRECLKQMEKQPEGGQIINISSIAAKIPSFFPLRSLHCATKAAIGSFAVNIQKEMDMDKKNIKIATIYPGSVFSEWAAKRRINPKEFKKHALNAEDVAYVVWMIINQGKNSNITEVTIPSIVDMTGINNF